MINEVRRFEQLLGLEKDFTVVYWDQRGCGRSLRGHKRGAITVDLMVNDTVSLLELLRDRFDTKPLCRRVLPRCHDRRLRRRTAPGPRGGAGGGRHGHRRCGRREQRLRLRAQHRPPTCQQARHSTAGGHRSAPAPGREAVRHPGPLGLQLWGSDHQRDLRRGGPGPAGQPAALVRTTRSGTCCEPFAASPPRRPPCCQSWRPSTSCVPLPRLDVPVVMVQGRLDQVAPGDAAQRYVNSLEAPTQATRVVRELGPYAPSRGAREIPGTPDASSSRSACQHLSCDQSPTPDHEHDTRPTRSVRCNRTSASTGKRGQS